MTFRIVVDPIYQTDLHILCLRPFVLISVQPHDGISWSMNLNYKYDGKLWALEIIRGMAEDPKSVMDEAFKFFSNYYEACKR